MDDILNDMIERTVIEENKTEKEWFPFLNKPVYNVFICDKHKIECKDLYVHTPCKYRCNVCNKRRVVNGYNNPSGGSTPVGYMHLVPYMCDKCGSLPENKNVCIWCWQFDDSDIVK